MEECNMKKIIAVLIMCIVSASLVLSGCSGSGDKGGKKASGSNNGPVTLTYYVWGNENEIAIINQIIAKFEEKEKNIKIELERSTGDYFPTLKTKFAGHNEPDIFCVDPGEVGSFMKEGLLLGLDEYINNSTVLKKDDLWPVNDVYRYKDGKVGSGDLYAIIKDWTPDYMMVYNKDQFKEAGIAYPDPKVPMTWDEFLTIARKLTKRDSNGNVTRYGTDMSFGASKHLYEYIAMTGGSVYSGDGKTANLENPQIRPAIDFFVSLKNGKNAPAQYTTGSMTGDSGARFASGQTSIVWYGLWAFPAYEWDKCNFEIGIAPPPVYKKGDAPLAISSGLIGQGISADTMYPDEAWKFLEFYMTEGQKIAAEAGFNIPGNKTIASGDFLKTGDANKDALHKYFYNAGNSYTIPMPVNINISQGRYEAVLNKEFTLVFEGKQSVEQALQNCDKQLNDILKMNQE
jgi:multiple sugar transport system substrate-binding protein